MFSTLLWSRNLSASNNDTTDPYILPDANIEYTYDKYKGKGKG